jgi:hypothetical protein
LFGDVETNGCGGRTDGPASHIHNVSPSTSLDSCSDATCIGCPDVPLNYRDDVSLKTSAWEHGRKPNRDEIPAKRVSVISSETTRMVSRVERSSSAISCKSHSSHAPPVAVASVLEVDEVSFRVKQSPLVRSDSSHNPPADVSSVSLNKN